jgi:rare lipoprotein A
MRKSPVYAVAALLALIIAIDTGCGRRSAARAPVVPKPARIGSAETGVASWYGVPYDGRRASSGEIYDMRTMTAAHRTLPFDTWVEVTNLDNGRQVEVRINDRGPFVGGRVIDLSLAAATRIDMVRSGTARVRLQVIPAPVTAPSEETTARTGEFAVQAGAFSDRQRAEAFSRDLRFAGTRVLKSETTPVLWRVFVGGRLSKEDAEALASRVRASGNEAIVVKDVE